METGVARQSNRTSALISEGVSEKKKMAWLHVALVLLFNVLIIIWT